MKFLGDIDLEHGELKNAAMHNAASAPSNPVEGQLWFDTTVGVKALKVYTGTAWVLCALGAHTHAGGDITSAVASASNADSADALSGKAVPYGLTLNNHDMLIYNAFNNSYEAIPATSAPSATSIPVTDADGMLSSFVSDWKLVPHEWNWLSVTGQHSIAYIDSLEDFSAFYTPGQRVRMNNPAEKFFIIIGSVYNANDERTEISLFNAGETLGASISDVYVSSAKAPAGFPLDPSNWTITVSDTNYPDQQSPDDRTWYNVGSLSITIPVVGAWLLRWTAILENENDYNTVSVAGMFGESAGDPTYPESAAYAYFNSPIAMRLSMTKSWVLPLSNVGTFFFNINTDAPNGNYIAIRGDKSPTLLEAVCLYL